MKTIKNLLLLLCLAAGAFACDDQFEDDLVRDNRPEVPVTFPGAVIYGFNPYYSASLKDTAVTSTATLAIQMAIPENSQRNIQEVSKVVVGATGINVATLSAATRPSYVPPFPGNGKTASFTTPVRSFYLASGKLTDAEVTALRAPGGYVERALLFLVTLDDDTQVVPMQLRVRFTP